MTSASSMATLFIDCCLSAEWSLTIWMYGTRLRSSAGKLMLVSCNDAAADNACMHITQTDSPLLGEPPTAAVRAAAGCVADDNHRACMYAWYGCDTCSQLVHVL